MLEFMMIEKGEEGVLLVFSVSTWLVWDELHLSVTKVRPTNQQSLIDEPEKVWNEILDTYLENPWNRCLMLYGMLC